MGLIQGSFSGSIIQACAGRPPIRASQSQERNVRSVETVLLREYGVVLIYRADFYVLAKDGIDTRASTVIFVGWLRRSVHVFCNALLQHGASLKLHDNADPLIKKPLRLSA